MNLWQKPSSMFIYISCIVCSIVLTTLSEIPGFKKKKVCSLGSHFPLSCPVTWGKGNGMAFHQKRVWFNFLHFCVFPDMFFLQGSEVIFKVALSLLGSHKPLILQHENLETIVDFIKNTLPNLGLVQMEKTINQV